MTPGRKPNTAPPCGHPFDQWIERIDRNGYAARYCPTCKAAKGAASYTLRKIRWWAWRHEAEGSPIIDRGRWELTCPASCGKHTGDGGDLAHFLATANVPTSVHLDARPDARLVWQAATGRTAPAL